MKPIKIQNIKMYFFLWKNYQSSVIWLILKGRSNLFLQNMQTNYTFKKYGEKLKHMYKCTKEHKKKQYANIYKNYKYLVIWKWLKSILKLPRD